MQKNKNLDNDLAVQLGGPNLDAPGFRAVPSLRYLSMTPTFFFAADGTPTGGFDRDGRFKSLRDALRFYVRRDTNPEEWYPVGPDGTVQKFDDLPPAYRGNVNTTEVPYNR